MRVGRFVSDGGKGADQRKKLRLDHGKLGLDLFGKEAGSLAGRVGHPVSQLGPLGFLSHLVEIGIGRLPGRYRLPGVPPFGGCFASA